jgi:hypothetical protein
VDAHIVICRVESEYCKFHPWSSKFYPFCDMKYERGRVAISEELKRQLLLFGVQRDVFSDVGNCIVGAPGGDAFCENWEGGEMLFINPPFHEMQRVVDKLTNRTRFVLLAPFWPRAKWFPKLAGMSTAVNQFSRRTVVCQFGTTRNWNIALFYRA